MSLFFFDKEHPVEAFPRPFWWLVGGTFLNRMGSCVYALLAVYLTSHEHLTTKQAGSMLALYGVGSLFAGPVGGFLADNLGRRWTLLIATCTGALSMIHVRYASPYWQLAVSIALLGFGSDLYRPAAYAWVADLVAEKHRPRAYGLMYWAANLGYALALLIAGWLMKTRFHILFWVDAMTTLGFGLLVFIMLTEPIRTARVTVSLRASVWESLRPYRRFALVGFLLAQLGYELTYQQSVALLSLDIEAHGFSMALFGALGALNAGLIILVQPFVTPIFLKWSLRNALLLGCGLLALGIGSLGFFHANIPQYVVAMCLVTGGEIVVSCTIPSVLAKMAPDHLRGSYQGAYQLMLSVALVVSPIYGTYLYTQWGSVWFWRSFLVLGLLTMALHALLSPWYRASK